MWTTWAVHVPTLSWLKFMRKKESVQLKKDAASGSAVHLTVDWRMKLYYTTTHLDDTTDTVRCSNGNTFSSRVELRLRNTLCVLLLFLFFFM